MDDGQPTADGRPEAGTPTADREIRNPKYALRTTQPEIRNPKYEIRILALGRPEVYCEDRLLTQSDWAVAKARELLFYLLAHPPRTRDQIGQALWPDATPAQWSANCRTTLHRLRRALGHADWILFQDDRYSFNRDRSYFYDVDAFERLVKTALSSPDPGILAQAVALYRGAYLEDMAGGDWIEQRREAYHQQAVTARLMLGRALLETQHTTEAVEQYRALLRQDNYLEEAHRELMRAYARLGEVGQALEHYQSLVNLFKTELGTSPDPATQALAQRLRRGDPV